MTGWISAPIAPGLCIPVTKPTLILPVQYSAGIVISITAIQDDAYVQRGSGLYVSAYLCDACDADWTAPYSHDPTTPGRLDPMCFYPPAAYQPEDWPEEPCDLGY